jgi:SAM-dependent methyltransferase
MNYDNIFFDYISIGSMRSAAIVAPLVLEHYSASSLVDVGCGRGAWLAEWARAGVKDYVGVDGNYVDRDKLLFPVDRFVSRDLARFFDLTRKFDLAVSLEVGEHIIPEASETFVDNICRHSDAILFSAAVPGQGGTMHINERDYDFWRTHFVARGYRLFDFVRKAVCNCREVEPWYRYNCMFFARGSAIAKLSRTALASEIPSEEKIPIFAPISWRLRNAIIKRLPTPVVDYLIMVKHRLVLFHRRGENGTAK